MLDLLSELFPLNRSLTGKGVRETLRIIQRKIPALKIHEVPSGTKAFDWTVPDEWNCFEAYLVTPRGKKICNYSNNNLHLVGYSEPTDRELSLTELQPYLHSLPEQPDAIPYVTSYYKRSWGFCLPHSIREKLSEGTYKAVIRSKLEPGNLTYGELLLPSTTKDKKEILLSTYICHPSMANNELSGPVVATYLAEWLESLPRRRHAFRILFLPETIGALVYLSQNLQEMKENTIAGFVLTCLGDERCFSFIPSRNGKTLADRAALHTLKHKASGFKKYTYLDRGSDERQYCSPGIDLPVATICRSKYHEYPEYHTSQDNLELVTQKGLEDSLEILQQTIQCLEQNETYQITTLGEPQLGKYGLYPSASTKQTAAMVANLTHLLAYADGKHDLLSISEIMDVCISDLVKIVKRLTENGLLKTIT